LRARARRLHRQYKSLGLIVVDYLQLMSASSSGENRATELSEISRGMKALAKELNCPVMALSQHGPVGAILHQRTDFAASMMDGRVAFELDSTSKSAEEIAKLWTHVHTYLRKAGSKDAAA